MHLHNPKRDCALSNFAAQEPKKSHPGVGPAIVDITVVLVRGMELRLELNKWSKMQEDALFEGLQG